MKCNVGMDYPDYHNFTEMGYSKVQKAKSSDLPILETQTRDITNLLQENLKILKSDVNKTEFVLTIKNKLLRETGITWNETILLFFLTFENNWTKNNNPNLVTFKTSFRCEILGTFYLWFLNLLLIKSQMVT